MSKKKIFSSLKIVLILCVIGVFLLFTNYILKIYKVTDMGNKSDLEIHEDYKHNLINNINNFNFLSDKIIKKEISFIFLDCKGANKKICSNITVYSKDNKCDSTPIKSCKLLDDDLIKYIEDLNINYVELLKDPSNIIKIGINKLSGDNNRPPTYYFFSKNGWRERYHLLYPEISILIKIYGF